MRRCERPPLPKRHGLEPACLRLPESNEWATIRDFLVDRLAPHVTSNRVDEWIADGRVVDAEGPIGLDAPYVATSRVWFHRDLPDETPVPFEVEVIYRDESILVADKPHFLATIPRGKHILETALVRLRHQFDLPDLVPAHRLDRATAGLVLFVVDPTKRGAYQGLFGGRTVRKTYEAIAPYRPDLELPQTVRTRIRKDRGTVVAYEEPGEANSESLIELIEERNGLGRYRLSPHTGKTHQLRLHMNGLGVPIVGDDIYPVLRDTALDDYSTPMQLLAKTLEFVDPLSGERRRFESRRRLSSWPPLP
ncbi:pseudouridine synthase [Smaragdicoccus niigatensis]|uniref:pseudouridine synthase n=1 Tax=Smaragdicoccus niigatensis TaxID=359359 RepID=UPI00037B8E44|nr:pseudouridine synthase [Smaragdicoccus niigatensis]